jgi:hypothetical protein
MKRLVETDRWKDSFFVELHPNAKLLLSYMYDNCNEAGFIDLNWVIWSSQLNMQQEFIKTSLIALSSLLVSDKKKKLFIKDFLKHQRKLPLIKGNEESDLIIEKLQSNLKKFNDAPEILELLNSVKVKVEFEEEKVKSVKKNRTQSVKFTPPSYEDFEAYYLSESPDTGTENIKELFDHYVGVGWVTKGGTPVKDYQATIRNAIRRAEKNEISKAKQEYVSKSFGKEKKQSRTDITFSLADSMKKEN